MMTFGGQPSSDSFLFRRHLPLVPTPTSFLHISSVTRNAAPAFYVNPLFQNRALLESLWNLCSPHNQMPFLSALPCITCPLFTQICPQSFPEGVSQSCWESSPVGSDRTDFASPGFFVFLPLL